MNPHREQAETLFQAGKRDLLCVDLLIQSGRAPNESIGFHAQQACEKFLKTVAVLHGIVFERTHDLIVLRELLDRHQVNVPVSVNVLRALNSYAVQFRYEACPIELMKADEGWRTANELATWSETELRSTSSQGGLYGNSR